MLRGPQRGAVLCIGGLTLWMLFITVWMMSTLSGRAGQQAGDPDGGDDVQAAADALREERRQLEQIRDELRDGLRRQAKDARRRKTADDDGAAPSAAGGDDASRLRGRVRDLEASLEDCNRRGRGRKEGDARGRGAEEAGPRGHGTDKRRGKEQEHSSREEGEHDSSHGGSAELPERLKQREKEREKKKEKKKDDKRHDHPPPPRRPPPPDPYADGGGGYSGGGYGDTYQSIGHGYDAYGGDPRVTEKSKGITAAGLREELELDPEGTIAVVVFTYKRHEHLRRCLERISDVLGGDQGFRIFVSQDGSAYPQVTHVAESFRERGVVHLLHARNDSGATLHEKRMRFEPYYAIAHHYGWALAEVFSVSVYRRLIVLEEDIEVGTDFFRFMQSTSPLLDDDPTLWCISAWNDNGKAELVSSHEALYRTDFFPGLGWMLRRELWDELAAQWPAGFWDDWLRQPKHRKGRACLRPEVPRTFTWCDGSGASRGQFCRQYLSQMRLEEVPVDWSTSFDPAFYVKDAYDEWLDSVMKRAKVAHSPEDIEGSGGEYKIYYTTNREFKMHASMFGLMTDFKDNVPRTAYRGVVSFRWRGSRVHLASRLSLYE